MSKSFSLSSIIPEPLAFVDDAFGGDGTRHDVLTAAMLSSADLATLEQIQVVLQEQADPGDLAAIRVLEQRLNEFVRILVPTLPEARVAAIPVAYKAQFIGWWSAEQPQATAGGRAPGQRIIRGRRSPGLSTPTASRRAS